MKIGIITFHFAHNYGAMLQTFALQETLKGMGHEAFIVDYAPEYHTIWFKRSITWRSCITKSPKATWIRIKNKIRNSKNVRERYDNFEFFKATKMNLYPYDPKDDMSGFDAVILGSDQIWNENLTNHRFDGPYYGDGIVCKVFSYAASTTYQSLTKRQEDLFREKLSKMAAIGVRERQLQKILQPLTKKPVVLNLDPTLLCDVDVYSTLCSGNPLDRNYVLVYELSPHKEVLEMAKRYAKRYGLTVMTLVGHIQYYMREGYDLTASPADFVSYFKNADCIFTTSFHGTAFSILFRKKFYAIKQNDMRDGRILSLLSQLNLTNQFIEMESIPNNCEIDYESVQPLLTNLIEQSKTYIKNSLS